MERPRNCLQGHFDSEGHMELCLQFHNGHVGLAIDAIKEKLYIVSVSE